jgi:hypothetical protein
LNYCAVQIEDGHSCDAVNLPKKKTTEIKINEGWET